LPKINAFKQYYIRKQELVMWRSSCDAGVTWRAKQPNITYCCAQ